MTRDEHIAAAEKWLAEAEQMYASDVDDGADVAAAAGIAAAHAALAGVSPIIVTMRPPPTDTGWIEMDQRERRPHPSNPAGQRHDGQEAR